MNNEEINKKLLDDLKNLPKVDAPKNFETELWRKINSSEESKKEGFWEKLFSPGKIAPAAVAIVSAAIIFFVVDVNPEEMEDPLNIAPRLREDLVVYKTVNEVPVRIEEKSFIEQKKSERTESKGQLESRGLEKRLESSNSQDFNNEPKAEAMDEIFVEELESGRMDMDTNKQDDAKTLGGNVAPFVNTISTNEISRNSVNFMQRSLTTAEKDEVQQLKMKVESQKSAKTDENRAKSTQK
jgi:hypothetical protein